MRKKLQTNTYTFQELIGNWKKYKVPDFQRDYSWEENNWEDLWEDLILSEKEKTDHYMWTIVLQTNDWKTFYIIDWQQRIATIIILITAILKFLEELINNKIEPEKNKERKQEIERKFIWDKSISKLHYDSKLKLNKNDNTFFQTKILTLQNVENISRKRHSEKLLYEAREYFFKKLKEKFKDDNWERIWSFLEEVIADKLFFTVITVEDELEAYTVFETLNARWIELTPTDLIKNYLFSVASKQTTDDEMEMLKETWDKIIDKVWSKEFLTFLRYFLNARQDLVRKEFLFKTIKKQIKTVNDVFNFINKLEPKAELYNAIKNPEDPFWNDFWEKSKIQKSLYELKLFKVIQPTPLLFALYDYKKDFFYDILKRIVVISFRYNVIVNKNPNELERLYNKIAKKITTWEIATKQQIIDNLKEIYINDEEFKNSFATKQISTWINRKLVKYILVKIENHLSNKNYDYNDSNITIEHILPENYNNQWNELFSNEASKFIYRLWNYTLLEASLNKECANKPYEEKKQIYKKSSFKLANELVQYDEWNIETLSKYQRKLADIACWIWKF